MADPKAPTAVHDRKERQARGYSWETAQPGNYLALRHGAYSNRIIDPLAQELADALLAECPDLDQPRYRFSVAAWARAETRVALLQLFLDAQGIVHTEGERRGEPRERILRELRAEENRAAAERERLGLSPTGHAVLARARAEAGRSVIDLDAVRARGREALAARGIGVIEAGEPPDGAA